MKIKDIVPTKNYYIVTPSDIVSILDYKSIPIGSVILFKSKESLNTLKGVYIGKSFFSGGLIIRLSSTGIINNGIYAKTNDITLSEIFTTSGVNMILYNDSTPFVIGTPIDLGVAEIDKSNLK